MTEPFRIALIQTTPENDPEANLLRAERMCREAAAKGAVILCLPELFRSRYFCQKEDATFFDLAEPIPGPTVDRLGTVALETETTIIAPLFEKRGPGLYHNSAAILSPSGDIQTLYRKMHIPDDPSYYEKFYFTPGDTGFFAVDTPHARIAVLICWDQWFPEAARLAALDGAEILFYPTAIGWLPQEKAEFGETQYDAWRTVQRGHAIANGLFAATVNRAGREEIEDSSIEFWGGSFVSDPQGRVLAEAARDAEEILMTEIDLSLVEETRRNWPFLRDRRIDAYDGLLQRFRSDTHPPSSSSLDPSFSSSKRR
ncbi:MAG: acyltransferase [Candidatus Hydrogenedentota bacterium]|nr:MAG: acyltransferase [Candidatus Hydrogenedentota bacterium]